MATPTPPQAIRPPPVGHSTPSSRTATTIPTPPLLSRARLPTSSPSSARLRALAPSPVKVPPTPPLLFTHPTAALGATSRIATLGAAILNAQPPSPSPQDDTFDFAPLELAMNSELLLESCREVLEHCRDGRQDSIDSDLPLIFDSRGDFGQLAQRNRDSLGGPKVPEGENDEVCGLAPRAQTPEREGESLLSPREYLASTIMPRKVLVEFRDVFSSQPSPEDLFTKEEEKGTDVQRTNRDTSVAESFATFGPGPREKDQDRRPSTDSDWSFTLSAYDRDESSEGEGGRSPKTADFGDDSDSPCSSMSEADLVTPQANHLYRTPMVDSDDTPTPTKRGIGKRGTALKPSAATKRISSLPPHLQSQLKSKQLPSIPVPLSQITPPQTISQATPKKASLPSEDVQPISQLVEQALRSIDKSLTIQLWVDQEGTREVRTTLRYRRAIKPQVFRDREIQALEEADLWCESPTRPELFQQTGCFEFGMDPKERDKWQFHHAALEGLPVLRRLTVNKDDRHDFLSKGATLQIRDSGVYAVYGHEDRGRLEWKFEYLVTPRVSPTTGEYIRDEKIIVPMGFYCSPGFFAPERAYKINLINVFKKSLTPNIISEKVKAPKLGKPPPKITSTAPTPTPVKPGNFLTNLVHRSGSTLPSPSEPSESGHGNGSSGASGRVRTPTAGATPVKSFGIAGGGGVGDDIKLKKPRKRATSLFSRARPFTPPVNPVPLPPLPHQHQQRNPSPHPFTTQIIVTDSSPSPTPSSSSSARHLIHQGQTIIIGPSVWNIPPSQVRAPLGDVTALRVAVNAQEGGGGLSPAPRPSRATLKKRMSSTEPRLGAAKCE
ncbi:hypothetical protein P7C73_g232, partial [Tremellales sp. Uapishka_1]